MSHKSVLLILLLLLTLGIPAAAASLQIGAARPVPGGVSSGGSLRLAGAVGQAEAGTLSGGSLRLNGGLLWEILPTSGEILTFHLPMLLRGAPYTLSESEPNDYFYQANSISRLPVRVLGQFDGSAGTGDLFALSLLPGEVLQVRLETDNSSGVQLLAYNPDMEEITRDYEAPFEISFAAVSSGVHYVYAYTPGDAGNGDSYLMRLWRP